MRKLIPMAARRLLIVMLILLGTSTLAMALVPPPPERTGTTTTTTTERRTSPLPAGGQLVKAEIDADAKRIERIEVPAGDQLALSVRRKKAGQVEIPGLGLVDDIQELAPARFDILATEPGSYAVRLVDPPRKIGVIVIAKDSDGAPAKGGGGKDEGKDGGSGDDRQVDPEV